ncbi:hypothetical protein HMPREF1072_00094, partial [Bacteroides uniformis CL03T00C23]
ESKSQLTIKIQNNEKGCFQWFKDTKMKANHNVIVIENGVITLFPMVQRY